MKKQVSAAFAIATLLLTLSVGSNFAHGSEFGVRANIPFDFVIGTKTLPQGTYTVKLHETSPKVLIVRGQDNNEAAFAISITVSAEDIEDNSPKLIFHQYGDQYFLSQVWSGARLVGQEIPKSQQERELAKDYLAKNASEPEIVSIAAL